jgi:hypothetical protein
MTPDQSNTPDKSLSEISHLFLSSVRDRQTGGAPRPVRKPPASNTHAPQPVQQPPRDISIDLTPEEFEQVYGGGAQETSLPNAPKCAPISAVMGTHLNGRMTERVRDYASHLASNGQRIGLIECDASIFRLWLFERNPHPSNPMESEPISAEGFDARKMAEALEELSWDVDHWLLLLPSPRSHEARMLLRDIEHWILLSTCDHDGVVACYRTLKGLADDAGRPRTTLALLDAADEFESKKVFDKLASVSRQFLTWPLEAEASVTGRSMLGSQDVAEHLVLCCRATRDKAQLATAPQWQILMDFLARSKAPTSAEQEALMPSNLDAGMDQHVNDIPAMETEHVADVVIPERAERSIPKFEIPSPPLAASRMQITPDTTDTTSDVIDLPSGSTASTDIISAILQSGNKELIECPVKPPMCPEATLAVGRDHRITLLAVAHQGLSDLRAIGRAYQWLLENRPLISMAVPQFSIDAHQLPRLQLLVDQADLTADILQPMLQSSNVTVVAYRKLRWAGRTGLLLNAA